MKNKQQLDLSSGKKLLFAYAFCLKFPLVKNQYVMENPGKYYSVYKSSLKINFHPVKLGS
jgi:hypothetical protein